MLKKFLGDWSTKTIVAIAIGAALYGVLMVWGSIPVFTNTYLTSAMIVPVVVGALFGPVPAMVCNTTNSSVCHTSKCLHLSVLQARELALKLTREIVVDVENYPTFQASA